MTSIFDLFGEFVLSVFSLIKGPVWGRKKLTWQANLMTLLVIFFFVVFFFAPSVVSFMLYYTEFPLFQNDIVQGIGIIVSLCWCVYLILQRDLLERILHWILEFASEDENRIHWRLETALWLVALILPSFLLHTFVWSLIWLTLWGIAGMMGYDPYHHNNPK